MRHIVGFRIEEALSTIATVIAANVEDMKTGPEKRGAAARKCLGDKRLKEFLRDCRDTTDVLACEFINEELDQGETLESIFSTQDDRGYELAVRKLGEDEFEISFGCVVLPLTGDGGRWIVRFDSDDRIKDIKEVEHWQT